MKKERYLLLKTKLQAAKYLLMSSADVLLDIRVFNVSAKQAISIREIEEYLILSGNLISVETGTSDAAKQAARALELFKPVIDIAHATKGAAREQKLSSILDGLVADTGMTFTDTNKTYVLALGSKLITTEESWGFARLTEGDIDYARSL